MITLYTIPGSAATVPRIALDEAGADYLMIELKRDETGRNVEPEGYDLLNPMGTVPTLVDDDLVVTEAAACCLYIAEKYPDAALMPTTGSHDWATTLRWLTPTLARPAQRAAEDEELLRRHALNRRATSDKLFEAGWDR